MTALLVRLEHPTQLAKVGVSAGDLDECAALALTDGATTTNPRSVSSVQDIVAVYRQAL